MKYSLYLTQKYYSIAQASFHVDGKKIAAPQANYESMDYEVKIEVPIT